MLVRAGPVSGRGGGAYHGECRGGAVVAVVRGVQGGAERARTTASAGRGGGSADPPSPEAAAAAWAGRCLLSPSFLPELRI